MKKQIIDALKLKYKNLGLSEKVIESMATMLEPTVTEESQIETAIAGVEPILKAFQGDADKVRGEKAAAEKARKELEDKIKTLTGSEKETETTETKTPDDAPAWAKSLLGTVQTLNTKIEKLEGEKLQTGRKSELSKLLEKLPENLRKGYSRTSVENFSEEEWTSFKEEIKTEVDEVATDLTAKGVVFETPKQGNGANPKEPSKADQDLFKKSLG